MHSTGRIILTAALLSLAVFATGGLPMRGLPMVGPAVTQAESPGASPGTGGDARSPGEGPGLVGAPILAVLAVVGLGLATTIVTTAYVRISGGRRRLP